MFKEGTLIGIISMTISMILLLYGYNQNKKVLEINGWPILKKAGKINFSYIHDRKVNDFSEQKKYDIKYHREFKPVIEYEYTVNGTTFQSNKITFRGLPWFLSEKEARESIDDVRNKDKLEGGIDIIYNPKDISESYLFYDDPEYNAYIASTIFFVIGFVFSTGLTKI